MNHKDRLRVLIICLVLGLGTIALFSPAFGFNFVNYEDELYVAGNPHVNKGIGDAMGWAFGAGYGDVWQPATWISHALDCQIYGLKPGGHHATNLILHAINAVLVFLVLRKLTGAMWRSAAVAAFFAWHPVHVEVFAWVAQRKVLLGAFFSLLALLAYAWYVEKSKTRLPAAKVYYVAAVVLFGFAVMSYLGTLTLPFILLLIDWWPLQRFITTDAKPVGKRVLYALAEKIPFIILAVAAGLVTIRATAGAQEPTLLAELPFRIRFANAGMQCFRYLAESVWPSDLGSFYPLVLHYPKWELTTVGLMLIVISVVAIAIRKTRPFWLTGWFWFLIAVIPALNVFQSGAQPMADRYMYLPSIGLWMLFCWEAYDLFANSPSAQLALGGVCAVLLAACCVASEIQLRVWRNEGTLVARISHSSENAMGHADYASYLRRHNQLPEAEIHAEKAVSIDPENPALTILLGEIDMGQKKYDQAIDNFKKALSRDKKLEAARFALGQAFLAKGQAEDSVGEFKEMILDNPKNSVACHWLARAFAAAGKPAEAAAAYRQSLAIQKNQPVIANELAWLLATDPRPGVRRGKEAVHWADYAVQLTHGQEPAFLGTLAAAYAEEGDFDKAIHAGEAARDLAMTNGLKALAETNSQLVALYREHKPFHQKQ